MLGSRVLGSAIASAACFGLLVACLDIGGTSEEPAATGGGGAGGSAGASGTGGSGFVWVSCDACVSGQCECVPPAPAGWSYVRVAEGKQAACPGGEPAPLIVGTQVTDPGCQPCACGNVLGGTCGVRLDVDQLSSSCKDAKAGTVQTNVGSCVPIFGLAKSMRLSRVRHGGSCEPGSSLTLPADFADPKTLCKVTSAGECGEGGACLDKAAAPFGPSACVVSDIQGQDMLCPDGYPNKLPYSASFDDTRKCSCPCKVTGGCTGGVAHYDCNDVGTNDIGLCTAFKITNYELEELPAAAPGGCEPEGPPAVTTGSVAPSGLRVVCCR